MTTFSESTYKNRCEYQVEIITTQQQCDGNTVPLYGLKFTFKSAADAVFEGITEKYDTIKALFDIFIQYDIDKTHIAYIIEDYVAGLHFFN